MPDDPLASLSDLFVAPESSTAPRRTQSTSYDPDTALSLISKYESGDRNVPNYINDSKHTAQGHYQITNTNWRNVGPEAGVDLKQYPSAMAAPKEVQAKVAKVMYGRRGFADWAPYNPKLRAALSRGETVSAPTRAPKTDPLGSISDLMTDSDQQASTPQVSTDPRIAEMAAMTAPQSEPAPTIAPGMETPPAGQQTPTRAITGADVAWHLGADPSEFHTWSRATQRRAARVVQAAVAEDERKKAAGETIAPPPLEYQNEMRRKAQMPELTTASNVDPTRMNRGPIAVSPKPFTFNQPNVDAEHRASLIAAETKKRESELNSGVIDPQAQVHGYFTKEAVERHVDEQLKAAVQQQTDAHSKIGTITQNFLDLIEGGIGDPTTGTDPHAIADVTRGVTKAVGGTLDQAGAGLPVDILGRAGHQITAGATEQGRRYEPGSTFGQVVRGLREGAGSAAVEIPKMGALGKGLELITPGASAATLPILGALGAKDEGPGGMIVGAAKGLAYHYGGGLTGPYISKAGNALLWVGAPAVESHVLGGVPWSQAIAESLPMGLFAGTSTDRVMIKDGQGGTRPARIRDIRRIQRDPSLIVPPADVTVRPNEASIDLSQLGAEGGQYGLGDQVGRPLVPERKSTIAAQIDAMVNKRGNRLAVVIPEGQKAPSKIPRGYTITRTDAGLIIHSAEVSPEKIQQIVKEGDTWALLGHPNPDSPGPKRAVVAYAGRDTMAHGRLVKAGEELWTSYADPGLEAQAVEEMRQQFAPFKPNIEVGGAETATKAVNQRSQNVQANSTVPKTEATTKPATAEPVGGAAELGAEHPTRNVLEKFAALSNRDLETYIESAQKQGARRLSRMEARPKKGTPAETRQALPRRIERQRARLDARVAEAQAELERRRGGTDKAPSFEQFLTEQAGGTAGGIDPTSLSPAERQELQTRYDEQYYPRPHHSRFQARRAGRFKPGKVEIPVAPDIAEHLAPEPDTVFPAIPTDGKLFVTEPVKEPAPVEPPPEPVKLSAPQRAKTKGTIEYGRARLEYAKRQLAEEVGRIQSEEDAPRLRGEAPDKQAALTRRLDWANNARIEALNLGVEDPAERAALAKEYPEFTLGAVAPKLEVAEKPDVTRIELRKALDRYDNEEGFTEPDLANAIEGVAADSDSPYTERLKALLKEYRQAESDDREVWGQRWDAHGEVREKVIAEAQRLAGNAESKPTTESPKRIEVPKELRDKAAELEQRLAAAASDTERDVIKKERSRVFTQIGELMSGDASLSQPTPQVEAAEPYRPTEGEYISWQEDGKTKTGKVEKVMPSGRVKVRVSGRTEERRVTLAKDTEFQPHTQEVRTQTHVTGRPKLRPESDSLERAIRAMGGIKDDGSGELAHLQQSGKPGLVTKDGIPAEEMATRLRGHGYGSDEWSNVQEFINAATEDARKPGRHYSSQRDDPDFTKAEEDHYTEQMTAEEKTQYEATQKFLASAKVKRLLDEVANGKATDETLATINEIGKRRGVSQDDIDWHIRFAGEAGEAAPESLREAPVEQEAAADQGRDVAYGADNIGITRERADAAKARIQAKISSNRLHGGADILSTLPDLAELGAYHIEAGARRFAKWSTEFVKEFNEKDREVIRPRLQEIYDRSVKVAKESSTATTVIRASMKRRGRELKAESIPRRSESPAQPATPSPATVSAKPEASAESTGKSSALPPPKRHVPGERSFPKTLERAGFNGGTDRGYEVITDAAATDRAEREIAKLGANKAQAVIREAGEATKHEGTMGVILIDQFTKSGNLDKAIEVSNDLSRKFTTAGQLIQSASQIRRYSPADVLIQAQREMTGGRELTAEVAKPLIAKADKASEAERKLAEVERQHPYVFFDDGNVKPYRVARRESAPESTRDSNAPPSTRKRALQRVGKLQDRLATMESDARARMQARSGKGASNQPFMGFNPKVAADVADMAIIGAAKLARKGIDRATWIAEMTKEIGAGVIGRKDLRNLYRESYKEYERQRAQFGQERKERGARKSTEGPLRPEDYQRIIKEREDAQKLAQRTAREFERDFRQLNRGPGQRVLEAGTGLRRANLLTAVKTHVRNFTSNIAFQGSEALSRPAAAMADMAAKRLKGTGIRTTTGIDIPAEARAVLRAAITEGPQRAASIILGREVLPLEGYGKQRESIQSKMQLGESDTGIKLLDGYINTVFRSMEAEDAIFKVYAFGRELSDIARSQAVTERSRDRKINVKERAKELRANPTDAMLMEAAAYADYATFQDPNRVSGAIAAGKSWLGPVGKFAVEQTAPFDRTPTNILYRTFENSPLGLISAAKKFHNIGNAKGTSLSGKRTARAEYKGAMDDITRAAFTRAEQKEFARTFGRASTGTVLSGLALILAAKGLLIGSSDYDDDKADYFRKRHKFGGGAMLKVPFTDQYMYIGDNPVGKAMGTAATMYEQITRRQKPTETRDAYNANRAKGTVKAVGRLALNQPLLQATQELPTSLDKIPESAGNYVGSFIPGSAALQSIGETVDPEARRTYGEGFAAQIKKNNPLPAPKRYSRQGLPVNTGVNKEERGRLGRRALRMIDPFNFTSEGKGSVTRRASR